jgi:hypothetical protein
VILVYVRSRCYFRLGWLGGMMRKGDGAFEAAIGFSSDRRFHLMSLRGHHNCALVWSLAGFPKGAIGVYIQLTPSHRPPFKRCATLSPPTTGKPQHEHVNAQWTFPTPSRAAPLRHESSYVALPPFFSANIPCSQHQWTHPRRPHNSPN